jgi:hypothetical protein
MTVFKSPPPLSDGAAAKEDNEFDLSKYPVLPGSRAEEPEQMYDVEEVWMLLFVTCAMVASCASAASRDEVIS